MNLFSTIKNWFSTGQKEEKVVAAAAAAAAAADIFTYMAGLVVDQDSVAKEVSALPRLETLSPENQRQLIPQLFERFEAAITSTMSKDELYKKLRIQFDADSLRKLYVPELLLGESRLVEELQEKASKVAQKVTGQVGKEAVESFVKEYTADNLLKGTIVDRMGGLDFTVAEDKFYKLPEQWLKLVEKFLQELIVGLESIRGSASAKSMTDKKEVTEQTVVPYGVQLDKTFSGVGLSEFIEQGAMRDFPAKIQGKSGETIPVALSGSVLKDNHGAVSSIVLAAKDLRQLQKYAKDRLSVITPVLQKAALGDFSESIEIGKDEDEFTEHLVALNLMIDDFREMMEEIQQKQEEMEAQNEELEETSAELEEAKQGLEEKVEERTKDLTKAQAKFKILYESSGDAVMTLEPPTWKFTSGNPACLKLFGVKTEKEFTQLGPWDLSPETQPNGQSSAEMAKKMIMQAMQDGSNFFEWAHKKYQGEDFHATVLLSRVEEGSKQYLQATVRDLTELEKAKQGLEEQVAERTKELEGLNKNLEDEVKKRTQELQDKLLELERFNKVAVGRELKMVELKEEIARLKGASPKDAKINQEV